MNEFSILLSSDENGVTGKINTELGKLPMLQTLRLTEGAVTSDIPDIFDELSGLKILDLENQFLSGTLPPTIYSLQNLTTLILSGNLLIGGNISTTIGEMTSLKTLFLNDNAFTGVIPDALGNLSQLGMKDAIFFLSFHCQSHKETHIFVPAFIVALSAEEARFVRTELAGTMPQSVCELREENLKELTADCVQAEPGSPFVVCDCCTNTECNST